MRGDTPCASFTATAANSMPTGAGRPIRRCSNMPTIYSRMASSAPQAMVLTSTLPLIFSTAFMSLSPCLLGIRLPSPVRCG